MIKHCVFLSLADPDDAGVLDEPMRLLEGLAASLPGMLDFSHGPNRDFEAKTPDHQYGFVATFSDRAAHLAYEQHPDHQQAGALLIAACKNGYEGILVADLETGGE
ncbi:MAG: Dabb family protein [Rhodospirillales bacterium]|nr:Dabb family protein [Rhodospirillales bacterium]